MCRWQWPLVFYTENDAERFRILNKWMINSKHVHISVEIIFTVWIQNACIVTLDVILVRYGVHFWVRLDAQGELYTLKDGYHSCMLTTNLSSQTWTRPTQVSECVCVHENMWILKDVVFFSNYTSVYTVLCRLTFPFVLLTKSNDIHPRLESDVLGPITCNNWFQYNL